MPSRHGYPSTYTGAQGRHSVRNTSAAPFLRVVLHVRASHSVSVDAESRLVAAAGSERMQPRMNIALLRFGQDDDGKRSLVLACAEFGIGRVSRNGHSRIQANSVRFGCSRQPATADAAAAGTMPPTLRVLLVGSQDRNVYALPTGLPDGSTPPGELRPLATVHFPSAINCAAASPDGRWLAATGDREELYVCGSEEGYLDRAGGQTADAAPGGIAGQMVQVLRLTHQLRDVELPAGCQYVAWNEDGTRLAASSDTMFAVAVFAVPPRGAALFTPLARFSFHSRPVLALSFLPRTPGGTQLLAWAEVESNAFVADVDFAGANEAWSRPIRPAVGARWLRRCGVQRMRLPHMPAAEGQQLHQRRITGLCVSGDGRLLVSLPSTVFDYSVVLAWCARSTCFYFPSTLLLTVRAACTTAHNRSKANHTLFPAGFRAAVRTLLLAAATPPSEGLGVWALPRDAIILIISMLAQPQSAWLPPRPSRAEEEVHLQWRGEVVLDSDAADSAGDEGGVMELGESSDSEDW